MPRLDPKLSNLFGYVEPIECFTMSRPVSVALMVALLRRGALAQQGQEEDVLTGQPEVVLPDGLLGGLDGLEVVRGLGERVSKPSY